MVDVNRRSVRSADCSGRFFHRQVPGAGDGDAERAAALGDAAGDGDATAGAGGSYRLVRQTNAKLQDTWNLGNSKGLEIIPFSRIELLFNLPPFFDH